MRVCKMADLPCCSVAFTSMCMMKLECFGKIKTHGKSMYYESVFAGMVFQLSEEVIIC